VSYDSTSNCFVGFSAPLINGLPSINHFQTDNFSKLEQWFDEFDKSTLVNAHLIEPLLTAASSSVHSRPFILSAYGMNNRANAIDILQRWIYIYDECKQKQIRVVGFSTDCDPRYLRAMQLSLGFFAQLSNGNLTTMDKDVLTIEIPRTWKFFFMRSTQRFLCMQDGVHLVTKIRNRLLSEKATMLMGGEHISVKHLANLIENHSKIDHNLVNSDVFPHDRQNYGSCLKITSDDVLNLLNTPNTKATYIYLYLLKLTILTYVGKNTSTRDRLYFGWIVAFVYRMWW
jgi:hypothetical protein